MFLLLFRALSRAAGCPRALLTTALHPHHPTRDPQLRGTCLGPRPLLSLGSGSCQTAGGCCPPGMDVARENRHLCVLAIELL